MLNAIFHPIQAALKEHGQRIVTAAAAAALTTLVIETAKALDLVVEFPGRDDDDMEVA